MKIARSALQLDQLHKPGTHNPLPFLVSEVRNGGEADKKVHLTILTAERTEQPGKQKTAKHFCWAVSL